MPPARPKPPYAALVAVALWGGSFIAVDFALNRFTPFELTAMRLALGALVLAAFQRARGQPIVPEREDRARCVLLGVTLAGHLSIQAYGLLYTSSVHTGWIIGFTPVVTALGAQFALGRRLRGVGWIGVTVATLGVWVITLESPADMSEASFGDALQLVTCVSWAVYTLAGVKAVERSGAPRVAGATMAVASALLIVPAFALGARPDVPGATLFGALAAIAYLGVFCNAVAFALWYRAQREYGIHRTSATLYLEPFVTLVAAMVLLGEPFSLQTALGGIVVLFGVYCVGRA